MARKYQTKLVQELLLEIERKGGELEEVPEEEPEPEPQYLSDTDLGSDSEDDEEMTLNPEDGIKMMDSFDKTMEAVRKTADSRKQTVYVEPGMYLIPKVYKIDFALKMVAVLERGEEVVFITDTTSGLEFVKGSSGSSLTNIIFRTRPGVGDAIVVRESTLEFKGCSFMSNELNETTDALVSVNGNSVITLKKCSFQKGGCGLAIKNKSTAKVRKCHFTELSQGIAIEARGKGELFHCKFRQLTNTAVKMSNNSKMAVEKCSFRHSKYGFVLADQSRCSIQTSKFRKPDIRLIGSSNLSVQRSNIRDSAIDVQNYGSLTVEENEIQGAVTFKLHGSGRGEFRKNKFNLITTTCFEPRGEFTTEIVDNTFTSCHAVLSAWSTAIVTMTGNTIDGIESNLAITANEDSRLTVNRNQLCNIKSVGIQFHGKARGSVTNNELNHCALGLSLETYSKVVVKENVFYGCQYTVRSKWGTNGEFLNNNINECAFGIYVEEDSGLAIKRNTITECHLPLIIYDRARVQVENNNFVSNQFGVHVCTTAVITFNNNKTTETRNPDFVRFVTDEELMPKKPE